MAHRPGPSSPPSNNTVVNSSPDASEALPASGSELPDDTNTSAMTPDRSWTRVTA